ncbi:dolichol phosphate-mannose biosynthesis regulatory protein-like [Dendronephthya gigantea]|uniref:dolichol phosphate-mannose biosynthesis regulatory protein-like n=1 Tax=Dendronephthya gigantea TaxID=151771 RepID=UPI00106A0AB9|nr:dolichol phosphate-mannose biosynthesis regulatory protein-like [Dendronephthya gigantea]
MATGLDQVVGMAMMSLGSLIFIYYTLWVVLLPFVDADHVIQSYFPDRMYAMLIPVVAGVLALLVIGSFIFVILLKKRASEKKSK